MESKQQNKFQGYAGVLNTIYICIDPGTENFGYSIILEEKNQMANVANNNSLFRIIDVDTVNISQMLINTAKRSQTIEPNLANKFKNINSVARNVVFNYIFDKIGDYILGLGEYNLESNMDPMAVSTNFIVICEQQLPISTQKLKRVTDCILFNLDNSLQDVLVREINPKQVRSYFNLPKKTSNKIVSTHVLRIINESFLKSQFDLILNSAQKNNPHICDSLLFFLYFIKNLPPTTWNPNYQ
jgi:hypothetical protein